MQSIKDSVLYFIPVIGAIHHVKELQKLNQEYKALEKIEPAIKVLGKIGTLSQRLKNADCYEKFDALTPQQKIRFSIYFERENQVAKLAFYGSVVRVITCLAMTALNPLFPLLGKAESLVMSYSLFKLVAGCDRYSYDPNTDSSVVYRRDLMGEQAFFGKKEVDQEDIKILRELPAP